MKKLISISFLSLFCAVQAQEKVFYYDEFGGKIYLTKESNVKFICFANESATQLEQLRSQNFQVDTLNSLTYKISGDLKQKSQRSLFAERNSNIVYISDMLLCNNGAVAWESENMFVKIFPDTDLESILKANNIPYKTFKRFGSNPQIYLVTLDVSEQGTMEYANKLTESKTVVVAQPSFWGGGQSEGYFSYQWNLHNIGQYGGRAGVDIKAEQAWALGATGSGVKVAVIDDGVDLTHPALINCLLPGYDATDGNDPAGAINGATNGSNNNAHGTAVAGLIASTNDSIKSIAYNAKIIPIRHKYWKRGSPPNDNRSDQWTANAVDSAWINGADIINCSWGYLSSVAINSAIDSAVVRGRSGLGCIVIASSGNYNSDVYCPANLPSVIGVGAISPCGERKRSAHYKGSPTDPSGAGEDTTPDPLGVSCDGETAWGSCYGAALDICAPGVLIPTIDLQGSAGYNSSNPLHTRDGGSKITSDFPNQNYTVWANGTSVSAPQVSAVAALVLSANPTLTGTQVRYIIESTAQKIRPDLYPYSPSYKCRDDNYYSNISNNIVYHGLLFNPNVGFGLVDAYAAVQMALCPKPIDLIIGDAPDDAGIEPNPSPNTDFLNSPNIWVQWKGSPYYYEFTTENQFVKPKQSNRIYVRVNDIGCQNYTSGATIQLFWAKSGMDLSNTNNWHLINSRSILSMPPGDDHIEEFFWYPPNVEDYKNFAKPYEFYLMAKIVWANDPLYNSNMSNFVNFVKNNNNIACRRVEIGSGIDLIVRDCPQDTVGEKNNCPNDWSCPDIWVTRGFPPSGTKPENPLGNAYNTVHVRIANRGRNPSSGTSSERLFLYWAKAGTSLHWSKSWDGTHTFSNGAIIGEPIDSLIIPSILPGKDTVLQFPWFAPDTLPYHNLDGIEDSHHFCLLARIVAPDTDPMFNEINDTNTELNVLNNNNISLVNTEIVEVMPRSGSIGGAIFVKNWSDIPQSYCLRFKPELTTSVTLVQEAEVTIKLGDALYNAWLRGGKKSQGVEIKADNTFLIKNTNANLCNLILDPEEIGRLSVKFNFLTRKITPQLEYDFYVVQTDYQTDEVIGGETYHVITPSRTPFYAQANDVYAFKNELITLKAADIGEPAIYRWYDPNGMLVSEDMSFQTIALQNKTYKLEVIALADGYKDYATAMVKIVPGKIEELFPNPASDELTVVCIMNNTTGGIPANSKIQITNSMGVIFNTFSITDSPQGFVIDVSNYPVGAYTVTLFCNGAAADTRTFVKE